MKTIKVAISTALIVLGHLRAGACICGITSTCGSIECQGHDHYPGLWGSTVYCTGYCATTYPGITGCASGVSGGIGLPAVVCSATCVVVSDYTGAPLTCSGSKTVYPTGPSGNSCSQGG